MLLSVLVSLLEGEEFVLQAMSYRSGHHSTSDDSSRYRTAEEMQEWRARDPVTRFQAFLNEAGWWDPEQEKGLRVAMRKEVGILHAISYLEYTSLPQ